MRAIKETPIKGTPMTANKGDTHGWENMRESVW